MTALLLALLLMLLLIAIETPVGVALGASGVVGLVLLRDVSYSLNVLGSSVFTATHSYSLVIIPMFILMGMFAVQGRLAEQVYALSNHAFRRLPGGLACATVGACAGFAAVTGSSVATSATMARLSVREMIRYGYAPHFAAGTVAAAGTLGVMIPPSLILVLYAILTGESTGEMLAAGIVPGLLAATSYMGFILVRGRHLVPSSGALVGAVERSRQHPAPTPASTVRPDEGSDGPVDDVDDAAPPRPVRLPYRGLFRIVLLFSIIMGGIYTGLFTATESGALGALAALIIMLIERRRDRRREVVRAFTDAAAETAQTTSMIFLIVVGSAIFSTFLVTSGLPARLATGIAGLDVPPLLIVGLMLLLMIPLGMALESMSILIITMPLLYPIAIGLGFDGVWFGILVVKTIELGLITPPVGIGAYVVAGSVPEVPTEQVFRGVVPFIVLDLALIGVLFAFPSIILWLPGMAR